MKYHYNKFELEDIRGSSCGWWCMLAFAYYVKGGSNFTLTKRFIDYDGAFNESLLSNLFDQAM